MGSHVKDVVWNMIISLLTVLFFSKSEALPSLNSSQVFRTTPSWQEVECRYDTKTKYLFSELSLTWEEAKGECQLYGGWLLNLNNLVEQNCLLKHAVTNEISGWFWHDGNGIEIEGLWVHDLDGMDLWMHTFWSCGSSNNYENAGRTNGDALLLGLMSNPCCAGAWCAAA